MSIKKQYGDRATTVFVKPPSIEILLQRLQKRNTETPESLRKRVDKAKIEMMFEPNFDIVIVNDDLQTALHEVDAVVAQFMRSPIG